MMSVLLLWKDVARCMKCTRQAKLQRTRRQVLAKFNNVQLLLLLLCKFVSSTH
jgi:hypothetical protein